MDGWQREDRVLTRGIDEALACRDMLQPAPPRPSLLARIRAAVLAGRERCARAAQRLPNARRGAAPAAGGPVKP
jgi:hypothetical protein